MNKFIKNILATKRQTLVLVFGPSAIMIVYMLVGSWIVKMSLDWLN